MTFPLWKRCHILVLGNSNETLSAFPSDTKYRPSGTKGFFWYSGKIISVYSVNMPLKEKTVVALN